MNKNQSTALFEQKSMYLIQMDFKAHTNFLINDFPLHFQSFMFTVFFCFVLFFAAHSMSFSKLSKTKRI